MTSTTPRPHSQVERTLAAALHAAGRGWHVFPLRPGDKRPAVRDWETRATTDPARIHRCWASGPYGVGVACGPSALVVLDLDIPKEGQAPPEEWRLPGVTNGEDVLAVLAEQAGRSYPTGTYTVATPSGGRHLYFHAPDRHELRNTTGRLGWLIDTRAHGGYVVAAGTTAAGASYTVVHEAEPGPLPHWLHAQLADSRHALVEAPEPAVVADGSGYLAAAISGETQRVADAAEGQRNHCLYVAATALGQLVAGGALPEENVRAALLTAARDHSTAGAFTQRQAEATIISGLRAGAGRPRSVAA